MNKNSSVENERIALKDFYNDIMPYVWKIELNEGELKILESFNEELADKLVQGVCNSLVNAMLREEVSSEYLKWAKFALHKMHSYFKK